MRHLLLILYLFKSIIANDDSDEKYIDLLPDDEKREFLEKIARRILEDYRNSNVPNESHVNISDDALNSHTAYVQGLLEEERYKQIERRDNQDTTQKSEANDRRSSENENNFIDLTLRTNKRDKRRNVQNDSNINEYNIIPVLPLYDEEDGSKKSENQNKNAQSSEPEKVSESDISKNSLIKTEIIDDNKNTSDLINLRQSFIYDDSEEKSHIKATAIDRFDENLRNSSEKLSSEVTKEESLTTEAILNSAPVNNSTTTTKIDVFISRKVNNGNESILDNENNNETIELISSENNLPTNLTINSQMQQTTTKLTTTKDITEATIISNIATFTSKEYNNLDIIDKNPDLLKNKSVLEGNNSITAVVRNIFLNDTTDSISEKTMVDIKDSDNMTSTTLNEEPNLSNASYTKIGISTKDISVEILNKNIMQTDSKSNNILYRARKKYLHKRLVKSDNSFIKDMQTIKNFESAPNANKSTYYVYEVSAESPQFISKNDDEEHPYYAPVYNFSPKFAYYSSYNKLGPNENDNIGETKNSLNDLRLFIKDIDRRTKFRNPNSAFFNPYKLHVNNVLKHKNQYNMLESQPVIPNSDNYNPNDYIDMDYFFGRNEEQSYNMRKGKVFNGDPRKYFPDTNEKNHPYELFRKGKVQDHVRAVRKILYAKQRFGFIPPLKKTEAKKHVLRDFQIHNIFQADDKDKDDIAIDYYFGRQSSQELSLSKNQFTYKYPKLQNFSPVTPVPIDYTKRSKENHKSEELDATVSVLKDFIKMDNENLVNYDWLGSAVDIQSALEKLKDLTAKLQKGQNLHPSDFELLKYVIYLYKSSKITPNEITVNIKLLQNTLSELRKTIKKKSLLPKIIKKKKGFMSAVKKWKNFATYLRSLIQNKKEILDQFQSFLAEVKFHLDDLHDAIKHIAMVTTYNNQRWHTDLKELYLKNADKRKLLQVILHLSLSRLFGLIEESSKNGLEDNFSNFIMKNKKEVETARHELKFILRLLDEFTRIN